MTEPMVAPLALAAGVICGCLGLICGMTIGHAAARIRPRRPVGRMWVNDPRRMR